MKKATHAAAKKGAAVEKAAKKKHGTRAAKKSKLSAKKSKSRHIANAKKHNKRAQYARLEKHKRAYRHRNIDEPVEEVMDDQAWREEVEDDQPTSYHYAGIIVPKAGRSILGVATPSSAVKSAGRGYGLAMIDPWQAEVSEADEASPDSLTDACLGTFDRHIEALPMMAGIVPAIIKSSGLSDMVVKGTELVKCWDEMGDGDQSGLDVADIPIEDFWMVKALHERHLQGALDRTGDREFSLKIVESAQNYLGVPYRYGGTTPDGFDCSGFVRHVFNENGIKLGRSSRDQAREGIHVSLSALRPGDLIFFNMHPRKHRRIDHVGLYIGDGQFIHAASSHSRQIRVEDLKSVRYHSRVVTARRVTAYTR